MIKVSYDLHIHSCLSPCGDDDMTPANIANMAKINGLDVIALTDHNSCKNCPALLAEARRIGLLAIPGMELTTQEEVHVLCLFPDLNKAMEFDSFVYDHLMPFPNREDIFGQQLVYNENDAVTGKVEYLLSNSTDLSFDYVYDIAASYGGIMIPAHINKASNSLLNNLGFIPPDSKFACVEVADRGMIPELAERNPYLKNCRFICNSDAHYLEKIHDGTEYLEIEELSAEAVLAALNTAV